MVRTRTRIGVAVALLTATVMAVPLAPTASASPGDVTYQSIRPDGTTPSFAYFDDMSADGSTVLFTGYSSDDNFMALFARTAGATVRVDDAGNRTVGAPTRSSLSDDGQWAAWASNSFSVGAPTRILLHNMTDSSRTEIATFQGGSCGRVEVANGGAVVAFDTDASLVAADTNSTCDVYAWSATTNALELVSQVIDPPFAGTAGARLQALTPNGYFALYKTDTETARP